MWLDRLSGYSTPVPTTTSASPSPPVFRSYSPAPRRQGQVPPKVNAQKPVIPARASSNSSSVGDSSLTLSRKPHGSGLKQSTTAESETTDPLEVLERLLGPQKGFLLSPLELEGTGDVRPDELDGSELELDFAGMTLQEVAKYKTSNSVNGEEFDQQTVKDFERDKEKFEDLHQSICACDDVLHSVEINLTSFQNDLAAVSAEIETLQARSAALSVRLENRKQVENGLGPFVEEISISPAVVRKIVEGAVDESWVRALAEVERRSRAMSTRSKELRSVKGIDDLKPLLDNLITKAIGKVRDFLVAQIRSLRSPSINAQIIQQQNFIRYKDLYGFLYRQHQQLAEEISQAYMNTMRWYLLNQFTWYGKALERMKLHTLDKHDVLGQDDGNRKLTILSSTKVSAPPHDAFNLGRRIDLLKTPDRRALSSFLAEEDKSLHYMEFPFRNFNLALIDNASAEYSFLTTFFSPSLSSATIYKNFNYIFEPTFNLGQNLTRSLANETYDCLGLLLCVRLKQHFAFELQRRKIPAVDGYINGTSMLLWPRFQLIMDQHCESVRNATSAISVRKQSASEQAKQSAAPHFMAQRFGQFMQGILSLSTEAGDDEPVSTSLNRLRSETEMFLTKISKNIGDSRKRERFLYNNYSLILTIIGDVEGKLAMEQQEHFESLKKAFGNPAS